MYTFYDTETTGKFDFGAPVNAEHQPHICQLGLIITDAQGRVKAELNTLIKPRPEWKMSDEAAAIHGITLEDCEKWGIGIKAALEIARRMSATSTVRVAHNIDFDDGMVRREAVAAGIDFPFVEPERFCTMNESTPILKIPKGRGGYKWPNLQEAHKFFTGAEFEGAHDAMADIRACKAVFFGLKTRLEAEKQAGAA